MSTYDEWKLATPPEYEYMGGECYEPELEEEDYCRICHERLPEGIYTICAHHESAPMDERWDDFILLNKRTTSDSEV